MNDDIKFYLDLLKNNPIAFGIESGFEDLEEIHNQWLKLFINSKDDVTLQAHRGSYKTTCLSIAIAIMVIIKPTENIIFLRKTDSDVKEIITQVANLLKTPLYQGMSKAIWGKNCELKRQSVYEVDTNLNESAKGTAQLLGLGAMSSMTGKHGDIIITDDIININDRISAAHRERTKFTYQELQNIKNRDGRIINTGTPWHKDDAFQLMPNIIKYDCYSTGLINDDKLQDIRNSMSSSLFASNYELKHIADENALFTNCKIDNGDNTNKIYEGIAHIDASYGGEDYTAFTIANKHSDGNIYVYGELTPKHIDDVLAGFEHKRKHYKAGTMHTEKNADKGYLHQKIQPPKKSYHEKMNKYVKISTHLKGAWDKIIFIKDTDKEYINQILDYTENAKHDDAPDSLASAVRELEKKGWLW
jgi:hypothetical protein